CPGDVIGEDDLPEAVGAARPAPPVVPASDRAQATPPLVAAPLAQASPTTLLETKELAEAERIASALRRHNNNRLRAAEELGISRMPLYKKLHRYNLMAVSFDSAAV